MKAFDWAALAVTSLLAALIGVTLWIGNLTPLSVTCLADDGGTSIGARGPLRLAFSRPVDPQTAAALLQIEPALSGQVVWEDAQTLRFLPEKTLLPGQVYTLRIQPGRVGAEGERIAKAVSWQVTVRPAGLLLLKASGDGNELYRLDLDGSPPRQLTQTGGNLREFSPSPDGEQIAYAVYNSKGGADLYLMDRDGANSRTLVTCDAERCASPAWSPDGLRLAYTRQSLGVEPGAPLGPERVRLLDLVSGQDQPLYDDASIVSYGPSFSPDGKKIATFDGVNGLIRVYTFDTRQEILLKSNTGRVGAWAPDSAQLAYTDTILNGDGYQTVLNLADLASGDVTTWLGGAAQSGNLNYDVPAWRPRQGSAWQAAVSANDPAQGPAWQLWIVALYEKEPHEITNDPQATIDAYSWDPQGDRLVFQIDPLAQAAVNTQIALYDAASDQVSLLTTGRAPEWLP